MPRRFEPLLLALTLLAASGPANAAVPLETQHRRPVALVTLDNGRHFLVANRRSGTISRVDVTLREVTHEVQVGKRLADLALAPNHKYALVADSQKRQLVVCQIEDGRPTPTIRIDLPIEPTRLAIDDTGRHLAVTSKWSPRLLLLDLPITPASKLRQVMLPMPGRHLLWLPGATTLVVADAFGGGLAVVDAVAAKVIHEHRLPAHNIGGLALFRNSRNTRNASNAHNAGDARSARDTTYLVVSHQVLNSAARTTPSDVFWGLLMTNNLRRIPIQELLSNKPLPIRRHSVVMLGQAGNAAGDPAGLAIRADGSFVVALSGVHQVGIGRPERFELTRIPTGVRPTALWLSADERRAVVTSNLDDRLDLLDLHTAKHLASISLGPRPESTASDRGERMFFDAGLSRDGWMSCHSCHTDGHSNGRLADTLGDGQYGNAKRVLSLLGTLDTRPWAWDGRMATLSDQVLHSVTTTMRGPRPTPSQLTDLVTYLNELKRPAPSRPAASDTQRQSVAQGRRLFTSLDCRRCHIPPLYTSPETYDVGLGTPNTNPPSLRGIAQRRRLFHDNRARSIEEVLGRFNHQLPRKISNQERTNLAHFLKTL